jgi:hypothetical protein
VVHSNKAPNFVGPKDNQLGYARAGRHNLLTSDGFPGRFRLGREANTASEGKAGSLRSLKKAW